MKKTLATISLIAALTASSHGSINVTVSALDGFLLSDDATGLLETLPSGWVQLIYFSTGSASTSVSPGGTIGVNESILAQFGITSGDNADPYGAFVYDLTSPQTSGSWYARVFEGGSSTTGTSADNIVVGTWYYQSPVYTVINNTTPETPDIQSVNGGNTSINFGLGDVVQFQVVPEPSVLAFLGLGGLALAARRRLVA